MIFDSNTSRVTSCGSAGAGRAPAMGVSTGLIPWSSFVGAGRLCAQQFGCQEWNACQSTQVIAVSPCLARNSGPARRLVLAGKNDAGNSIGHPPVEGLPGRGQRRPRPGSWRNCGIRYARTKAPDRHAAYRPPPARNGATQAPTRGLRATPSIRRLPAFGLSLRYRGPHRRTRCLIDSMGYDGQARPGGV